jgi:restriction endonuclease Mrr
MRCSQALAAPLQVSGEFHIQIAATRADQMTVTAEQLTNLQRRLQRREHRFHQASRYIAQFNAFAHSRTDAFDERLRKNFENRRESLAATQQELRELLASSATTHIDAATDSTKAAVEVIVRANDALLAFLADHPNYLHSLHSRTFEELIARIFIDLGCTVELMQATHDGGKDIILRTDGPAGPSLSYVQCKRYSPFRPVRLQVVRDLFGVHTADRVNKSMIVTTSYFTPDAVEFARDLAFLISLRDYSNIVSWLAPYRPSSNQAIQRTANRSDA